MASTFLVKSFEEDFSTKTLVGKKKVTCQTLDDIMTKKIIRPNTKSFGQKKRLSTTILHEKYTKTYRPQGIIFETEAKPDYVLPFDLVLLSDAQKMVVHYYRIKDNLHFYYNHNLIEGYEIFVFKDMNELLQKYSSPEIVWKAVNSFRIEKGYAPLQKTKYKLVEYNEAVFYKNIKIKPVALFGYTKESRLFAKKYNLQCFASAKKFYKKQKEQNN